MAARVKKVDVSRFEGGGISFKAKLIGIEDVAEARGDQMCQMAITKLKNNVKLTGQHKQKILVNVTLEGLKIIDAISMVSNQNKKKNDNRQSKSNVEGEETEKPQEAATLHTHPVHQISFISRDVTDNRAFGYVFSSEEKHEFYAIKTSAAAEMLVLTLRDLFQVVYEMKKQEVDEAKLKLGEGSTAEGDAEKTEEGNHPSSGNGSTSGIGQAPIQNADTEGIYQVPQNNAPVNPTSQAEKVANLLDLEDQAENILKGIEQIKNLEFDSLDEARELSPTTSPTSPPSKSDPWGVPASSTIPSSDLASLTGFNTASFGGQSQAFPGTPFAPRQPIPGMSMPGAGLPVTKDPFGNDLFANQFQHQGVRPTAFPTTMGAPGFPPANPFGPATMGQPFVGAPQQGMGMPAAMMGPPGMMSGMAPQRMVPPPAANPFSNAFGEPDPNVLVPIRNEKEEETSAFTEKSKGLHEDLFGDLVGMKKSTAAALTPKDMFAQISAPEKKSMNELKSASQVPVDKPVSPVPATQASFLEADPFGEMDCIFNDKTRSLVTNDQGDPFDTSHIPALPAVSPAKSSLFTPHQSLAVTSSSTSFSSTLNAPPVPQRQTLINTDVVKECSLSSSPSPSLLPSSSSALPQKVPFDCAPSIAPPPLPVRKKENISATSSSSTPTHLPLGQESTPVRASAANAFLLPSPDEPPPPLPENFQSTPAAPPPPPRPSIPARPSPSSSCSNSPKILVKNITPQPSNLINTSSPNSSLSLSREDNRSDLANTNTNHSINSHNNNNLSTAQSNTSQSSPDPFNIPLKPSSNIKSDSSVTSNSSLSSLSDPFASHTPENVSNSSKVVTESSKKEETVEQDPFGIPLHLIPGFKVVAKFGSDPFEDSFHAGLSDFQAQEKWEPFTDTTNTPKVTGNGNQDGFDPWNPNAFGDPFVTSNAPPVNGNAPASGGSLLD